MQTFDEFYSHIKYYKLDTWLTHDELRESFKYSNGCGSKGGFKFPSTMWGVKIEAACNLHDIDWQNAECYSDLVDANRRFNRNLKRITDDESANDLMAFLRRMRIAKYVAGVELVGTESYAKERGFELSDNTNK